MSKEKQTDEEVAEPTKQQQCVTEVNEILQKYQVRLVPTINIVEVEEEVVSSAE